MRKCMSCLFLVFTSPSSPGPLSGPVKIFYRVVADIAPGEELLLFMKSEDYPHETMAPDIHGEWSAPARVALAGAPRSFQKGPSCSVFVRFLVFSVALLTYPFPRSGCFLGLTSG